MSCVKCSSKENLKIDLPKELNKPLMDEYVSKRNGLSTGEIHRYFNLLFNVEYVYNPKQVRRAVVNMDQLYYVYIRGDYDELVIFEDKDIDFKVIEIKRKKNG